MSLFDTFEMCCKGLVSFTDIHLSFFFFVDAAEQASGVIVAESSTVGVQM